MKPAALLAIALALLAAFAPAARAHDNQPAYLLLRQTGPETYDAMWKLPATTGVRPPLEVVLPDACTPNGPRASGILADSYVDRWSFRCPGGLEGRRIQIEGLKPGGLDVLVRIETLDGATRTLRIKPAEPWADILGPPTWFQAAQSYLVLGIEHILGGLDHLLFVLGLLFIVRNRSMLFKTVTSFTIAHSITLAIATLGYAYPPVATLNALIALSILFLGPEIIRVGRGETSLTIRHPWIVAFAFGLIHGFGFASGLIDLGIPRAEIPLALVTFNVGVEIGQLGFIALFLALGLSFRVLRFQPRSWLRFLPGYIVGSLGAAWTIGRLVVLIG
ncbi:MAG: HupE/UreJ family protein [Phycisphaerales bacterium]|nr:HupE/UreJ family protein [Phycisphaerales bacterium]